MKDETNRRTLINSLVECAEKMKDRVAITFLREAKKESSISYTRLNQDSNRMANTLRVMGVEKGDRVILLVQKSLIFVVAYLAILKLGAIAVPLNPGFKKSELTYLLQDAEAKLVLADPGKEDLVREIDPNQSILVMDTAGPYEDIQIFRKASTGFSDDDIFPDDPGLIIYTSGTTGNPKGAILTHANLLNDAENIKTIWEFSDSVVLCHALPLFHIHGLCFALNTSLLTGTHVIMLDKFSPQRVIEVLVKNSGPLVCTMFMGVPAMYTKLLSQLRDRQPDFRHIRLWTSGSAPLLPSTFHEIARLLGKEPVEREGMSETGMNFSNPIHGKRKPRSIGVPLPNLAVRIVDPETKKDVEPGKTGEIWLKGHCITSGYWKKPEETEKAFVDGWFRTGDTGYVDEEGYYFLTDRIKHIIISGGENISPVEIETVINRYEGVAESSVVGLPDEKWGEKVIAAVVQKAGHNLTSLEIQDFCKKHLHDWKCPKQILFVKKLPRNTMGKVLKETVKELSIDSSDGRSTE